MRSVYKAANLDPRDTSYFEAHGTGTIAGDVIEVNAIGEVFCEGTSGNRDSLYLGSIKANIGHTEGCSGIAGLMKAMLVLKHRVIPPVPNVVKVKDGMIRPEWNLKVSPPPRARQTTPPFVRC
jgi:acyl transferase domain-containing protein